MTEILAEHRLLVKRHAAKWYLGHFPLVAKAKKWTDSNALLLRRINLELDQQTLNPTSLARRYGKAGVQRTLYDILEKRSDAKVSTIHVIADALGVAPWRLFLPLEGAEGAETHKVVLLPTIPPIIGPSGKESRISKGRRRKLK